MEKEIKPIKGRIVYGYVHKKYGHFGGISEKAEGARRTLAKIDKNEEYAVVEMIIIRAWELDSTLKELIEETL